MSDFKLRAAYDTDAGKIGAILSEFIDETPWMPRIHSRAEDVSFAGSMIDREWVTVALQSDVVVGFLALDGADIHSLYVTQAHWRTGCGRTLIEHAKSKATSLSLWTFQFNELARLFYVNQGFIEVEHTDGAGNDEKLADIRFEWQREAV